MYLFKWGQRSITSIEDDVNIKQGDTTINQGMPTSFGCWKS